MSSAVIELSLNQFYSQKLKSQLHYENPIIISDLLELVDTKQIQKNFTKELQQTQSLLIVIVQLLSQKELTDQSENVKLIVQLSIKEVFNQMIQNDYNKYLKQLDFEKIFHQKIKSQSQQSKSHYNWSLRLIPEHRSINRVISNLPPQIVALSQCDILSYQKVQKVCKQRYILSFGEYSQSSKSKLQNQVFLNWGQTQIQWILSGFKINRANDLQPITIIQKSMSILIIPGGYQYCWKIKNSDSCVKLLNWNIIPKSDLLNLVNNLQNEEIESRIYYPIYSILRDYIFHEFSTLNQDQSFMFDLANIVILQPFNAQNSIIQAIKKENKAKIMTENSSTDNLQCNRCDNYIFNYYGKSKGLPICVNCVNTDISITEIYQKMSQSAFNQACQILTKIQALKIDQISLGVNSDKLFPNLFIFQYQDFCDGNFIGLHHNTYCKPQQNKIKQKGLKNKLHTNYIQSLKSCINLQTPSEIVQKYAKKISKNQPSKHIYEKILKKAAKFLKKQDQQKILQMLIPDYNKNSMKIMAIKILASSLN